MQHVVAVEWSLPLTLTLSLRERKQQPADGCLAQAGWANSVTRMVERQCTKPPSPQGRYLFTVVELVALRRVAPRPAAQRLPANGALRASRSAAPRGGVVAARQPLPLNRYSPSG